MVNIFTGLSQNQINSFEKLILSNRVKGDKILISNTTLTFDHKLWDEVLLSNKSFNNNSDNFISSIKNIITKIKEYNKIIRSLKKYKDLNNINVFYTYIEDILNNFLVLSFSTKVKGYVVEDGTLNYYDHTIDSLSKRKIYLKWFISNLLRLRFKLYKGHSSGIEYKHVVKQYVRQPELSMFPAKSELIDFNKYKFKPSKTILIIGQEAYINVEGIEKYNNSLDQLINIIFENHDLNKITKVYYKPHRHGQRIDYQKFKSRFKKKQFIVIEDDSPLEEIYFNRLKSSNIYGFDSSALVNIYLEIDNDIKTEICINVLLNYNDQLESLFKKCNFKIFK